MIRKQPGVLLYRPSGSALAVAYASSSGDTHLMSPAAATILETLDAGAAAEAALAEAVSRVAADSDSPPPALEAVLGELESLCLVAR